MLLSEKNTAVLDDILQEQRRSFMDIRAELNSKPESKSHFSIDRMRGHVPHSALPIESRLREMSRENNDLKDSIHQKTIEEHFQTIYAQQESVQNLGKEHSETLASMFKKLDQLSVLVPSQRRDPWPGSYQQSADKDPELLFSNLDCAAKGGRQLHSAIGKVESPRMAAEGHTSLCILEPEHRPTILTDYQIDASTTNRTSHEGRDGLIPSCIVATGEKKVGEAEDAVAMPVMSSRSSIKSQKDRRCCLERLVTSALFEIVFAILILLNTVYICVQAEYGGYDKGHTLGVSGMQAATATGNSVFHIIGRSFSILFTVELVTKMLALRLQFFRSAWNVFDLTIISIAWITEVFEIKLFLNPMLLRLLRLVRLIRLLRGLTSLQDRFENLFLMVRGITAAVPVLLWVIVLVTPMIASCALFMNFTLQDFMDDPDMPLVDRLACYEYFGTFTKATLSIFEVTFGNWVPICRFMYSKINTRFAFFFMGWKLVVGIAVLRIIYGVFLYVTFSSAATDDESVIAQKNRENKKREEKMMAFFKKFDSHSHGYLTKAQFMQVFEDPNVKLWLSGYLDLQVDDADLLYTLVDNLAADDKVHLDQMVHGFERLKGAARSIDSLNVTRLLQDVLMKLDAVIAQSLRAGVHGDKAIHGSSVEARTTFFA